MQRFTRVVGLEILILNINIITSSILTRLKNQVDR